MVSQVYQFTLRVLGKLAVSGWQSSAADRAAHNAETAAMLCDLRDRHVGEVFDPAKFHAYYAKPTLDDDPMPDAVEGSVLRM